MPAVDRIHDLLYPWQTTNPAQIPDTILVPIPDLSTRTHWVIWPTGTHHTGPWTVRHPALLDQIEHTITGSTTAGQTFHAAYGSKPAARLDALNLLGRINRQSLALALAYNIPLCPLRPRLSHLAGLIGLHTNPTVTGWWVSARVLTQHDGPPMALNAPCPNPDCDAWGTLRVRFDPNIALCVHCSTTWENLDQLAVWVQWASVHLHGPTHKGCYLCLVERSDRQNRATQRRMGAIGTGVEHASAHSRG